VLTESDLDGIEIYKPAIVTDDSYQHVVDFKCPQCGAVTAFSVADGGLKCTHCGFYEAPQKEIIGKGAQQFEFTVETMERAAHGWGESRRALECQNCGAIITMPAKAMTATCPFCASNKVVHHEAPQDILRPRFLIPFGIEPQVCRKLAREWLGNTWMTPKELRKLAKIADFVPIYLPFWTFDAIGSANWQAEVGHTKTERYYDHSDRAWKTRTKTVWYWESGHAEVPFDDVLIQGTKHVSRLLLGRIDRFNLNELVPYEPSFLAGFKAQAYDFPLESAWEESRSEMRESTRKACLSQASSTKIRNFSMNLDFNDESWRYILLPVYVASYVYRGKVYQALLNGQNGAISGQRPVDWNKVWLVVAALLLPGIVLGVIGLVTLLFAGIGVLIGGFGFVLLIIGIVVSVIIFQRAQGLDDV
jgi:DNA-directed RNA polymerase subunit RPC12/RpoP